MMSHVSVVHFLKFCLSSVTNGGRYLGGAELSADSMRCSGEHIPASFGRVLSYLATGILNCGLEWSKSLNPPPITRYFRWTGRGDQYKRATSMFLPKGPVPPPG